MIGCKAICQQRDVLDIWDAVGAGAEIAAAGVTWTTARTFHRDQELFNYPFADRGQLAVPAVREHLAVRDRAAARRADRRRSRRSTSAGGTR